MTSIISIVLAGGRGKRLAPMTDIRAKPSVPFAGQYRIIDFVLSNLINSGLSRIYLLTQFKSHSLQKHLQRCWQIAGIPGQFIDMLPAQMWKGEDWYQGTADAVYQNLDHLEHHRPDQVCVFSGDHIYTMNVRQMLDFHQKTRADMSVAALRVPVEQAHRFGVVEVDDNWRMTGFQEKPSRNPVTIPGEPGYVLGSMGNYVVNYDALKQWLLDDHQQASSRHDFGMNIIPEVHKENRVMVYDYSRNQIPGTDKQGYWQDVGTVESYWQAHMDILAQDTGLDLRNPRWPIRTYVPSYAPATISPGACERQGKIINSLIGVGCYLKDVYLKNSVLGYNVTIDDAVLVRDSVIFPNCVLGRGCMLDRVILDKYVSVQPGVEVSTDNPELARAFGRDDSNLLVIPKGTRL